MPKILQEVFQIKKTIFYIIKGTAALLAIIIVAQLVPAQAIALKGDHVVALESAETDASAIEISEDQIALNLKDAAEDAADAPIVGEVEELREENAKYFLHPNGTFTAAIYAEPVHYQDESGEWQDVDNSLALDNSKPSDTGEAAFAPASSGFDIRLPQEFEDGQKLSVAKEGRVVGLGVSSLNEDVQLDQKAVVVDDVKELASEQVQANRIGALEARQAISNSLVTNDGISGNIKKFDSAKLQQLETAESETKDNPMDLVNLKSAVTYPAIFPGADLEYIVTPSMIKENIVVKEPQESYTYQFDLALGGLFPVQQEDGSFYIMKSAADTKPMFILEAPVMYDALGEESNALSMLLGADGLLTLTANSAWMNDSARQFPVVIDPTLTLNVSSSIQDCYVSKFTPNTKHNSLSYNYVGKGLTTTDRTYMKFSLPTLPNGAVVTSANMQITQALGAAYPNLQLCVFEMPYAWDKSSLTWNTQTISKDANGFRSDSNVRILDYSSILGIGGIYQFDLTKVVRNWYENGNNNGLMLAVNDETKIAQPGLYSMRLGGNDVKPVVTIDYINHIGLEDHWRYETLDFGHSGSAYINDYNGSLTYVHNDLKMTGNRIPLNISHVYNSNSDGALGASLIGFSAGSKFHLNLEELVVPVSTSDALYAKGYRYALYDADGTKHYFIEQTIDDVTNIVQEFDTTITLIKDASNKYEISDAQGNKKFYGTAGVITKIRDHNGNYQLVTWSGNKITQVVDGGGRVATFEYTGNLLTSITDPAGRSTSYAYNSAGQLTTITYPGGTTTSFAYQNNNLSQIIAEDGSSTAFSFGTTAYSGARVNRVTRFDKAGVEVNFLQFVYTTSNQSGTATGNTVVYDNLGKRNTYLFDDMGRMASVTNQNGQTKYQVYHQLPEEPTEADRNTFQQLQSDSELQTIATNLLKNHGFEQTGNWAHFQATGATGTASYVTDISARGTRAYCLEAATQTTRDAVEQTVTGALGATYTLTADVMIPYECSGDGVWIGFDYVLGGQHQQFKGISFQSTSGWERRSTTFTLPAGAQAQFTVYLALESAAGTVYFDNVQLEQSGGARHYNLVENSDFSNASGSTPANWTKSNTEGSEGVTTFDGRNWVWLTGSPMHAKMITQAVPVNAKAGETVIIGGKGAAYATGSKGSFGVLASIYSDNATEEETLWIPFDSRIAQEHQVAAMAYTLETDCHHIVYSFVYANQIGNVSFDDAFVYVGEYGVYYDYDQNKGLLSDLHNDFGGSIGVTYSANYADITNIEAKVDSEIRESVDITYDSNHNITSLTDQAGVTTSFTYTNYGQMTSQTITKGTLHSTETMTYTSNQNYMTTYIDPNGGVTSYVYDASKGLLTSATDPNGNVITYTYDSNTDELLSTSGSANPGTPVTTAFTTQDRLLKTITRNGMNYSYDFDSLNRMTAAKVGNQTLVTNSYDNLQRLSQQTYANGATYTPLYDNRDRMSGEQWNGIQTAAYYYNENDRLSQMIDTITGVAEVYSYDFSGHVERIDRNDGAQTSISYNEKGAINSLTFSQNGAIIHDASYEINAQGKPNAATLYSAGTARVDYTYDDLSRSNAMNRYATFGATDYMRTTYTYAAGVGGNTTGLISQVKVDKVTNNGGTAANHLSPTWNYTYDANGNILMASSPQPYNLSYAYDGLNRLVRENNSIRNNSVAYTYDVGGNITQKKTYPYATGTLGSVTSTINYIYGNTNWKDQLTNYNGKAITYDALGNPLTYDGYTYTWQRGRQLAGISGNSKTISYQYNASGQRVSKTVNGVTTTFTYAGGLLMRQSDGATTLDFFYDADGNALGFNYNGQPFFYSRTLQGDVFAVYDTSNRIIFTYDYDAYGQTAPLYTPSYSYTINGQTVTSQTVGNANPIRYRGYYFDVETGYYFCQTRYYSPEWCRWLNADSLFIAGNDAINASNMYAYCNGNPVRYSDPSGMAAGNWAVRFLLRLDQSLSWFLGSVLLELAISWLSKGDKTDIYELAALVYAESGNCVFAEQEGVAHTIYNRIASAAFPNATDIHSTISSGGQYQGYENNYYQWAINLYLGDAIYSANGTPSAAEKAHMVSTLRATMYVACGLHMDNVGGAESFRMDNINPSNQWVKFKTVDVPSTWKQKYWKIV